MAEDDLGAQSAPNPLVVQIDDKKEEIVVPAVGESASGKTSGATLVQKQVLAQDTPRVRKQALDHDLRVVLDNDVALVLL